MQLLVLRLFYSIVTLFILKHFLFTCLASLFFAFVSPVFHFHMYNLSQHLKIIFSNDRIALILCSSLLLQQQRVFALFQTINYEWKNNNMFMYILMIIKRFIKTFKLFQNMCAKFLFSFLIPLFTRISYRFPDRLSIDGIITVIYIVSSQPRYSRIKLRIKYHHRLRLHLWVGHFLLQNFLILCFSVFIRICSSNDSNWSE